MRDSDSIEIFAFQKDLPAMMLIKMVYVLQFESDLNKIRRHKLIHLLELWYYPDSRLIDTT